MSSQAPTYSPDQLEQYLQRIRYGTGSDPVHPRLSRLQQSIHNNPFNVLSELQRRHLCSIQWGNSSLHYSQHHSISVHPVAIFEKLVSRGLDGYCMETTSLFYGVLRSLGYQVYPTAGRVSQQVSTGLDNGLYLHLGHMVLIVTINGDKYMVDVGFGSACAIRPLPLKENTIVPYITPAEMRLVQDCIPEFTDKSQRVWIYQVRYTPESKWLDNICFSEAEFLPQDFGVLNFHTSQNPSSWFCQSFVCSLFLMDENEQEVQGQLTMAGREVKRRVHGQTEVLETLESEEDRIQALARWFGLHFREDEIQGICGLPSQIK